MSNLFDSIQKAAFSIVTNTFGYEAKWQPSDGSDYQTARVLFKEPTKPHEIGSMDFDPFTYIAEYHPGHFPGLKESIDAGNSERVTINEIDYHVLKVDTIWDGKTHKLILQKAT